MGVLHQVVVFVPCVAQIPGRFLRRVAGQGHSLVLQNRACGAHLDLSHCGGSIELTEGYSGDFQAPPLRVAAGSLNLCTLYATPL